MNKKLIVLDPRQKPSASMVVPAKRLTSLTNKRLGLLWNNRLGGDRLLKHVAELLHRKYHFAEIYFTRRRSSGTRHRRRLSMISSRGSTRLSSDSATEGPARRAVCSTLSTWSGRGSLPRSWATTSSSPPRGKAWPEHRAIRLSILRCSRTLTASGAALRPMRS